MGETRDVARRTPLSDPRVTEVLRTRPQGIGTVAQAVRIALATTVSYVVSLAISPAEAAPWFAPITTLLVIQTSPFATLGMSVQRVLGTGVGVGLATAWVNFAGVEVWTFLVALLASLLAARLLPFSLGGQMQIPVAVVFVIALGPSNTTADLWRVIDVFIGGAIGVGAVWLWPPKVRIAPYHRERDAYATAQAAALRDLATEIGTRGLLPRWQQHRFVLSSRGLREHALRTREEYEGLADAVRFNVRSRNRQDDLDALERDLRWLSGITIQIRGLAGALDRLYDRATFEPALAPERLRTLLGEVATLLESAAALGSLHVRDDGARVREDLREALDEIAQGADGVGEVLESVSILGRIDQLTAAIARGPRPTDPEAAESDTEEDPASGVDGSPGDGSDTTGASR
jgi:uncharacterized membrane protein YccC